VLICLINGFGDAVLALPAVRRLIRTVGPERVLLWAPDDLLLTVFAGVPCRHLPIGVDRFGPHFLIDPVGDERRAVEAIRKLGAVVWVSLNAYYPTWPIEERVRAAVRPLATWGFGDRPESLRAGLGVGVTRHRGARAGNACRAATDGRANGNARREPVSPSCRVWPARHRASCGHRAREGVERPPVA
jgi:hypothetical protein